MSSFQFQTSSTSKQLLIESHDHNKLDCCCWEEMKVTGRCGLLSFQFEAENQQFLSEKLPEVKKTFHWGVDGWNYTCGYCGIWVWIWTQNNIDSTVLHYRIQRTKSTIFLYPILFYNLKIFRCDLMKQLNPVFLE